MKKKYEIILFDLDSTLVKIEGLDWLAAQKGVESKIKDITLRAMNGEIPMALAMKAKMQVLRPSYNDLLMLGDAYCNNLVEDIESVVKALQILGKQVWIITGNFSPAVDIVAKKLSIDPQYVICNKVFLNKSGEYLDFDQKSLLSKNGGKRKIIRKIFPSSHKRVVFIGDGYTDFEANDTVDMFLGYGGVVRRQNVEKNCEFYILCESLSVILPKIITRNEQKILSNNSHKILVEKAEYLTQKKNMLIFK